MVSGVAAALAAAGGHAAPAGTYLPGRVGSTLGTADQVARDRLAARIFASAPVQNAIRDLEVIYAKDPTAAMPDASSTIRRAAEATAMAQAVGVVNRDADRPGIHWSTTTPHSWGSVRVPLSGLMVDDTDNIYRGIPIDGAASYEIRGKVVGGKPAQESFILHETLSGATKGQPIRNNEEENGAVFLDKLSLAPDGSFTITVDGSPPNGRNNHIQTSPEARDSYILIRDSLNDWALQQPVQLSVKRLSGPPLRPAPTEADLIKLAAERTLSAGPYWLAWAHRVFYSRPANTITHRLARVSGWGYINCGYYQLKDDEALVFRLERRQANYLGFQLSDAWGQGQALPYIQKTGSLNGAQARPNADGSYTYVISTADPGVHNWLNPDGLNAGTFCIRWQALPTGNTAEDAVKDVSVVKLADLRKTLGPDASWVTPAQRAAQLRERQAAYATRLTR